MYMFFLNWACFVKRARPMFHKEQSFVASLARNPHTYQCVHIFIHTYVIRHNPQFYTFT